MMKTLIITIGVYFISIYISFSQNSMLDPYLVGAFIGSDNPKPLSESYYGKNLGYIIKDKVLTNVKVGNCQCDRLSLRLIFDLESIRTLQHSNTYLMGAEPKSALECLFNKPDIGGFSIELVGANGTIKYIDQKGRDVNTTMVYYDGWDKALSEYEKMTKGVYKSTDGLGNAFWDRYLCDKTCGTVGPVSGCLPGEKAIQFLSGTFQVGEVIFWPDEASLKGTDGKINLKPLKNQVEIDWMKKLIPEFDYRYNK